MGLFSGSLPRGALSLFVVTHAVKVALCQIEHRTEKENPFPSIKVIYAKVVYEFVFFISVSYLYFL